MQLFRIAQEPTTNAIRHGQPDEITISIERSDHHVIMRISDNGSGIAADDSHHVGMSLRTMAYRARMIQGELRVHPIPSGGTEVVCSILLDS
jgi:signal transduction histidine kinase